MSTNSIILDVATEHFQRTDIASIFEGVGNIIREGGGGLILEKRGFIRFN